MAFSAEGDETLAPPVDQQSFALVALEESDFERVRLQFGGRRETSRYNPALSERARERNPGRDLPPLHGRFGGCGLPGRPMARRSSRRQRYPLLSRPALEEIFNLGPHFGTLIFEVGNPNLCAERGNGTDLSLRQRAERVDGEVDLFYYDSLNFVFRFATGEEEDGLPVVHFVQRDSRCTGAEAPLGIGLNQALRLNLGTDFDDARARLTRTPLLRIATPGGIHQFSANVFKIGEQLYRNHSSYIKDLPRRSVAASASATRCAS